MTDIAPLLMEPDLPLREAMARLARGGKGIVLVVDPARRLIGTITDGDIRRAMLASLDPDRPVQDLLDLKLDPDYPEPVTAPAGSSPDDLLAIMKERAIRQVPLLDDQGRVADLATFDDLAPAAGIPVQAVIMAGGRGTRLRPLTDDLPKPMLPVGGRPIMEYIVEQISGLGIDRVHVTTHYKPEKIRDHFQDGQSFGVKLTYVHEEQPLGTAGALGLMEPPQQTLLVINGDILTRVNMRAMWEYHREQRAVLTVALRDYYFQVPYGVVECQGAAIMGIKEKPRLNFFVNAGIYLLEPAAYEVIPRGEAFNMTDVIERLIAAGRRVAGFPICEYWLDIGQQGDYQQAQQDVRVGDWGPNP